MAESVPNAETSLYALVSCASSLRRLPTDDGLSMLTLTSQEVRTRIEQASEGITELLEIIARRCSSNPEITNISEGSAETRFEALKYLNDVIIDEANRAIDAASGITTIPKTYIDPLLSKLGRNFLSHVKANNAEQESEKITKPQLLFDYKPDNSDALFVPRYFPGDKINGISKEGRRREEEAKHSSVDSHLEKLYSQNPSTSCRHPYESEISQACQAESLKNFDPGVTRLFQSIEKTGITLVCTVEQLKNVCTRLESCLEIAVDLEHHSYRSFLGFICLIQISTRTEDFVIDAIALRSKIHTYLRPIFQNNNIVKVLHGANQDVTWLERCFSLYIYPLFDTSQASKILGYPSRSLAYLLNRFAGISSPNKKMFQRADWRVRPLPKAMLRYAQSDTHYLLYIYDRLRAELTSLKVQPKKSTTSVDSSSKNSAEAKVGEENWAFKEAWRKSADVARKRFRKPSIVEHQALRISLKYGLKWNTEECAVADALCRWRDAEARRRDESLLYIMDNRALVSLVAGRPASGTVVKQELETLNSIIAEAREEARVRSRSLATRPKSSVASNAQFTIEETVGDARAVGSHRIFSDDDSNSDGELDADPVGGVDMDAKYGVRPITQSKAPAMRTSSLLSDLESSSGSNAGTPGESLPCDNTGTQDSKEVDGPGEQAVEIMTSRSQAGVGVQVMSGGDLGMQSSAVIWAAPRQPLSNESVAEKARDIYELSDSEEPSARASSGGWTGRLSSSRELEDSREARTGPAACLAKSMETSALFVSSSDNEGEGDGEEIGRLYPARSLALSVLESIEKEAKLSQPFSEVQKELNSPRTNAQGTSRSAPSSLALDLERKRRAEDRDRQDSPIKSLSELYKIQYPTKDQKRKRRKRNEGNESDIVGTIVPFDYNAHPWVAKETLGSKDLFDPFKEMKPFSMGGVKSERVRGGCVAPKSGMRSATFRAEDNHISTRMRRG